MRIVIHTFGSAGDIFPHVGLALGLRARGHTVCVATHAFYRNLVTDAGLAFAAIRPDCACSPADKRVLQRALSGSTRACQAVFKRFFAGCLADTHADLTAATAGAHLLVAACTCFAAPFVARQRGLPWLSTATAPMLLGSRVDYPIVPAVPALAMWLKDHNKRGRLLMWIVRRVTRRWLREVERFGHAIGQPVSGHPLYDWSFSPRGTLGLFPSSLYRPQPADWPPQVQVTGWIPWGPGAEILPAPLARFLDAGPPPIVFSLGSWAKHAAGAFYRHSAEACARLGVRGVLLVGRDVAPCPLPANPNLHVTDYAPHAGLFPRASAIVHHGGMGSLGQALRAGKRTLIVPFTMDQFDNAYRLRRAGRAALVRAAAYTTRRAEHELRLALEDPARAAEAARAAAEMAAEDGVANACAAIAAAI